MFKMLRLTIAACVIALFAHAYAFQINSGSPGAPGADGHSPTVTFGTGSDADRLAIDGAVQGPHLTGPAGANGAAGAQGPQGATGPQGPAGTTQTAAQIIASLQAAFPGLTYMVSGPSASGAGLVPDTATQNTINALTTAGASTVLWRDTTGATTNGTAALTGKGAGAGSGTLTVATAGGISNATVTLIGKGGAGSIGTLSISTNGGIVAVNLTGQGTGSGTGSLAVLAQHLAAFGLTGQGGAGGAGTVTAVGGSAANFYTTGFNGVANGATTTADGWAAVTSGTAPVSQADTSEGHTATPAWHLGAGDGTTGGTAGIQRTMNIAAGTMTFWYLYNNSSLDASLKVYVNGSPIATVASFASPQDGLWHQASLALSAATGAVVKIQVETSQGGAFWIDDLSIPIP